VNDDIALLLTIMMTTMEVVMVTTRRENVDGWVGVSPTADTSATVYSS
jgi:hypothetical protein